MLLLIPFWFIGFWHWQPGYLSLSHLQVTSYRSLAIVSEHPIWTKRSNPTEPHHVYEAYRILILQKTRMAFPGSKCQTQKACYVELLPTRSPLTRNMQHWHNFYALKWLRFVQLLHAVAKQVFRNMSTQNTIKLANIPKSHLFAVMFLSLKIIQFSSTSLQLQFWSLKIMEVQWQSVAVYHPATPRCRLQRQQRSPDGRVAPWCAQCLPLAGHDPSWVAADPRAGCERCWGGFGSAAPKSMMKFS